MVNNNEQLIKESIKRYRALMVKSRDVIGVIAVELFNESFEKQGQVKGNGRVILWKQRGFAPPSTKGRNLLKKRGSLQRAIEYRKRGSHIVEIRNDRPYATIQNDGGKIQVTAKMRRFFWAMYYKHASRLVFNIADKSLKDTKTNVKRNEEAEFWIKMAMAKEIEIPARPFFYDTPELPNRIDKHFIKALQNIFTQ